MNLLELRQKFRILSGRYELVNDDGSDNGFEFHLNAGQKWLDRKMHHQKGPAAVYRILQPGEHSVQFLHSRAIREVWMARADESRYQLDKLTIQDFKTAYPNMLSATDRGNPLHFAPALLRTVPDLDRTAPGADFNAIGGYAQVMPNNYEYNGVLIGPPPDVEMHIEIVGYFYVMPLVDDDHINYWSANHPDILIMAALRNIEYFNRNTQGMNDYTNSIMAELITIDADVVDEELPDVMQLEG